MVGKKCSAVEEPKELTGFLDPLSEVLVVQGDILELMLEINSIKFLLVCHIFKQTNFDLISFRFRISLL